MKREAATVGKTNKDLSNVPTGLTFDGSGKPINMKTINVDKLPNLIGEHFEIREEGIPPPSALTAKR
jgi:hypothetical protein